MSDRPNVCRALVTGGSRGIGRAIAVALGAIGARVAVNYRVNRDAADEAARAVKDAGGEALVLPADVGSADDRERLVEQTVARFGSIDLLVNNAGVAPKVRADLLEMDETTFDDVLRVNLKGPFFLSQLVARQMVKQIESNKNPGLAAIVNIGSISAYTASVNRGEYCIAKAGLAMSTALFATRLAEFGICVYEIRPGIVATDMTAAVSGKYDKLILEEGITPIRRWGQPQDVARAVLAIAEGRLGFSTGEVINVDGGFHLHRL